MYLVRQLHLSLSHGSQNTLYRHSLRLFASQSFYDRIKSYYPSPAQEHGSNNNNLSMLTDTSLHNSSNVIKLPHEYKIIYVIGVSHHSRLSALRVQSLCDDVWPDTIFLELCDKRLHQIRLKMALQSPLTHKFCNIFHRISQYKIFTKYKHGPFIEAIQFGDQRRLNIECGDISSNRTMKRLKCALKLQSKPFEQIINAKKYTKYKFFNHAINEYVMHVKYLFNIGNEDENILRRERNPIRNVEKSRSEARDIVSKYSKTVYEILHKERDEYIAQQLAQCEGNVIVSVVGMGHLDGIERFWNHFEQTDAKTTSNL